MEPTLSAGDRVVTVPALWLRPGQIVTVVDPRDAGRRPRREMVKRLGGMVGDRWIVLGDNPAESTDSRVFGPVERRAVRRRVVGRYGPPGATWRLGPAPTRAPVVGPGVPCAVPVDWERPTGGSELADSAACSATDGPGSRPEEAGTEVRESEDSQLEGTRSEGTRSEGIRSEGIRSEDRPSEASPVDARRERIEALLRPELVSAIGEVGLAELRARRDALVRAEAELSFLRRVAQARLDLLQAEQARRRHDDPPAVLVDQLAGILAPSTHGGGPARPPQALAPLDEAALSAEVDLVAGAGVVADVTVVDDGALVAAIVRLRAYEAGLSRLRHRLHGRIDTLQAELVRRYRDGSASVDGLLP